MVKRRLIPIAIGLLLLIGGGVVLTKGSSAPTAPVTLSRPTDDGRVYGLGTVEARTLSRLGFELNGTLSQIASDQGDRVQRGQALASLDVRDQLARVAQAEAGVKQAQATLSLALARLDRAKALRDQRRSVNQRRQTLASNGTVSAEAAEDAQAGSTVAIADVAVAMADVEAARGGIDAAQAKRALEQAILDKSTLTAPYDGVIIERSRELGSAISPGMTVLILADPSTIWVTAYVDESLAGRLKPGQPAEIRLRSQPEQHFAGRIARLDLENDRVSEERRVQVAFDHPLSPFTLGEQAEILITTTASQP